MAQVERLFMEHGSNRPVMSEGTRSPERVYATLWQGWYQEGLVCLPLPLPAMTQEDATVAAGIIQYLGTKGGILLLNRVWKDIEGGKSCEAAWLKEFKRFTTKCPPHVNKGFTAFELCLAPAWTSRQLYWSVACNSRDPYLARAATRRELQVARAVFRWLSTISGGMFVEEAEHLVRAYNVHRQAAFHMNYNVNARSA